MSTYSLYAERQSVIHALHPLTKLALGGLIMTAGAVLPGVLPVYAGFVLLALPLILAGRVVGAVIRPLLLALLPFAVSLVLVQGLFWPGGTPILRLVGPLSFKAEGLIFAAASVGRLLLIISGFMLISVTTRPDYLMTALIERGLPQGIAYIVLSALQMIPRLQSRANSILDAQRARGLETEGSLLQRGRALMPLVIPLVLSSLLDTEERAIALEARGFGRQGVKTSLIELHDTPLQRVLRIGIVGLMIMLVAGRLWFALRG